MSPKHNAVISPAVQGAGHDVTWLQLKRFNTVITFVGFQRKKFQCDICNKIFVQKSSMKVHARIVYNIMKSFNVIHVSNVLEQHVF